MADLDDFFAKKDRKKSKTKKFATGEELAKKFEDTSKKAEPRPRKENASAVDGEDSNAGGDQRVEDEWKEFEEEERKDYTGLKISQLQVTDDNQLHDDGDGYEKYDSDGELNSDPDRQKSGPWKKVAEDAATTAVVETAPVVQEKPTFASNVYISPALRNATAQKTTRLKKGVLPDIHNEEYFPVLGAAKPEEVKKKRPEPGFEEVKHGVRVQRSAELSTNAPVSIGNRFNSLADS